MKKYEHLPDWLKNKYAEGEKHPETKQKFEKITDIPWLIEKVWCLSSKSYQEKVWIQNKKLQVFDSYDDTVMYFGEDTKAVLKAWEEGSLIMTEQQYIMLKKLYGMVEMYDASLSRPDLDPEIVEDPKWHEIREYAKEVYEELTKE